MCITSKSVIYDEHSFFASNIYKSKYKRKKETKMLLENVLKFFKAIQFLFYFIIFFTFIDISTIPQRTTTWPVTLKDWVSDC